VIDAGWLKLCPAGRNGLPLIAVRAPVALSTANPATPGYMLLRA
jgi:hypothetical protein